MEEREEPKHGMGVSMTSMESISDIACFLNKKEPAPDHEPAVHQDTYAPEARSPPVPEMPIAQQLPVPMA